MKKIIGLSLATVMTAAGLYAQTPVVTEVMQPSKTKHVKLASREVIYDNIGEENGIPFPEYSFDIDEVVIESNFYDYMAGSYCSTPMRIADNGRIYIAFHRKPTNENGELRRAYYAQIENGELVANDNITTAAGNQGYVGIDIDPVTTDPFYVWHENMDGDESYEVALAWEAYSVYPSLVKSPFPVIDNSEIAGIHTPNADDEYIWPYLFISECPTDANKRRIHVIANNYKTHVEGDKPSESVIIAYTDFETANLEDYAGNQIEDMEWNYATMPTFDSWNNGGAVWTRPFKAPLVTREGKVVFVGQIHGDNYRYGDENLFYFATDDIANPNWEEHYAVAFQPIEMPMNSDGSQRFDGIYPDSLGFTYSNSGHFNVEEDSEGNLRFIGAYAVAGVSSTDPAEENQKYFPELQYVKEIVVDGESGEFEIVDLFPQGTDIHDGQPALPWDLNADGEWDETLESEGVQFCHIPKNFPFQYWDDGSDMFFNENKFNIVAAENERWLAAIWQDSRKARAFNAETDEDYAAYSNTPELFICVSADNGTTWSKPLVLNSIDTPEFNGETIQDVYPANKILVDGEYGYLDLFYLDDNTWGSGAQGTGANDGGTQKYSRIKIKFSEISANENSENVVVSTISTQNYPNPFNPTTRIDFSIKSDSNVGVKIYNVKGELVKTIKAGFKQSGQHSVMWNGVDNNNNDVASGVYFYKVTAGNESAMNKMILMK